MQLQLLLVLLQLLLLLLLVQLQLLLVLHATPAAGVVAAPAAVWSLPAAADWPASHCQLLLTVLLIASCWCCSLPVCCSCSCQLFLPAVPASFSCQLLLLLMVLQLPLQLSGHCQLLLTGLTT